MKKILAIDYGEKKIGLAISDELGLCANPYGVIRNTKDVFKKIKEISENNKIKKILVGIPYWDKPSKIVDKIKEFVENLKKEINIEIELFNEFYSTKIAEEKICSIGKKYKKVKNKIDSYAACVILQEYLENYSNFKIEKENKR
ncbi:MAG: Holliday junction resolvase RuvX [Endomicrobiia bacterium]